MPPPPPPPPPVDSDTCSTPNRVPEGSQPKSTMASVLARSRTSIGTDAAAEEPEEVEATSASSKVKSSRLVKVDLRVFVKRATSTAR